MNPGPDFDRENEADRKYRLATQGKRAEERKAKKRLEKAAPALLAALRGLYNDCRNQPMDKQRGEAMEEAHIAMAAAEI